MNNDARLDNYKRQNGHTRQEKLKDGTVVTYYKLTVRQERQLRRKQRLEDNAEQIRLRKIGKALLKGNA